MRFVWLVAPALLAVAASLPAYAEVAPTDGGTLDVDLTTAPERFGAGEEIKMNIDFINPATQDTQVHIDYFVTVLEGEEAVFGPTNRIHTSEGKVSIPIQFSREGEYRVKVDVDGILFNPIATETAFFDIVVGDAAGAPGPSQPPDGTGAGGGGCLIATAAYGSELAAEVQVLRELRDRSLLATGSGAAFMAGFNQIYYSFSPAVADWERQNPAFKQAVKIAITPLLASLSVLSHAGMDSEAEVLAYGAGAIALNVGMYAGLPLAGVLGLYRARGRRARGLAGLPAARPAHA